MNTKDIQTPADVAKWLKHHVEWNGEASRDMMLRAVEVLTPVGGLRWDDKRRQWTTARP